MNIIKTDKHRLGVLCNHAHDYQGTGTSLLYKSTGRCVECRRVAYHKHYLNNSEAICAKTREYRSTAEGKEKQRIQKQKYALKNKEQCQARGQRYYKKNKKEIQRKYYKYMARQRQSNTQLAIRERLRMRVKLAMARYTESGKIWTSQQYGIDYKAIIEHLGPHPNTRGIKGDFHIDHIIPLSAFDLNDPEQVKLAFAPENHQWLRAKDNKIKKNHIGGQLNLGVQKQLDSALLQRNF